MAFHTKQVIFFFVSLKVFQCSMSFIALFLFCLFGTHVFNLRHTTNPWTLFLLRCCSKTCDNLRFRNHVLKKCISKLRKCVYLYREMNQTIHHSCSNTIRATICHFDNDSLQSRIFCFNAYSGCKSFWRNCFLVPVLDVYTVNGQFSKQNYLLRKCSSVQMHKNVWIGPLTIQARVPT